MEEAYVGELQYYNNIMMPFTYRNTLEAKC
jgi:hypothetical protein